MIIVIPIFLGLIFGLIEFALAFRTFQLITNIAREGNRHGVIQTTTTADVQARVDSLLANNGLNPALATVTMNCNGSPGTCSGVGSQSNTETVQIAYPHTWVLLGRVMGLMCPGCGGGFNGTITLTSSSTMRNE